MTLQEKQENDIFLYNNILASGILSATKQVYIYVSYGTEADTTFLIEKLLQQQQHIVAVPRVNGKEMDFYRIKEMADLKPGFNGIPEPANGQLVTECNGIMFMPGLVFDKYHGRIGYGGGYYDRYLPQTDACKIVLCRERMLCDHIASEPHDCPVDFIITEKRIFTKNPEIHLL